MTAGPRLSAEKSATTGQICSKVGPPLGMYFEDCRRAEERGSLGVQKGSGLNPEH